MSAAFCAGLLLPLVVGQVHTVPGGGVRPIGAPPIIVTNPAGGSVPGGGGLSMPGLKSTLDVPGAPTPTVSNPYGNDGLNRTGDSGPSVPATATRDDVSRLAVSGSDAIVPPPPYEPAEAPPDGGGDDDDDDTGGLRSAPWKTIIVFFAIGGLIVLGMIQSRRS